MHTFLNFWAPMLMPGLCVAWIVLTVIVRSFRNRKLPPLPPLPLPAWASTPVEETAHEVTIRVRLVGPDAELLERVRRELELTSYEHTVNTCVALYFLTKKCDLSQAPREELP